MRDHATPRKPGADLPLVAYLLFAHVIVLTFQITLRQVLIDTTYWRDVILVLIIVLWFAQRLQAGNITYSRHAFSPERWIVLLILYGLVVVVIQLLNDVELLLALRDFRNQFLPLVLFFVAKTVFGTEQRRARLVNFIFYLMCVLAVGVLVEELLFLLGISRSILPWYQFSFINTGRFVGNSIGVVGDLFPEDAPILGLLGWPHQTSAYFLALFAFCMPFILARSSDAHLARVLVRPQGLKPWMQTGLLLQCIAVLVVLGVKTSIITFMVLWLLLLFVMRHRTLWSQLVPVALFIAVMLLAFERYQEILIGKIEQGFVGTDKDEAIISIIFNADTYRAVIETLSNTSIDFILFGGYDFSDYWFYTFLEIRLLFFALKFGGIWLFLFLGLVGSVIWRCVGIARQRGVVPFDQLFGLGCLTMMLAYFVDMLHYGRIMDWPNIDVFAVVIGAMSSITSTHRASSAFGLSPIGVSRAAGLG